MHVVMTTSSDNTTCMSVGPSTFTTVALAPVSRTFGPKADQKGCRQSEIQGLGLETREQDPAHGSGGKSYDRGGKILGRAAPGPGASPVSSSFTVRAVTMSATKA